MAVEVVSLPGRGAPALGLRKAGIILIFLMSLIPVFATPVMPLIDFYNHLARYYVLAHATDPALARNYAPAWGLLPNLGLDLIATPLMRFLPPYVVARLLVVLVMLTQFSGVIALNASLTRRGPSLLVAVLAGGLLYSYILNWGFSNFLLGLGLGFLAAAWWVRMRERPQIALPVSVVLALVIFFTHGFAFGVYGLLLGGLEFGRWLQTPGRRWQDLARTGVLLAAQAVVPAIIFLQTPTSGAAITVHHRTLFQDGAPAPWILWEARQRVEAIVRVVEGPNYAFDLITFAAALSALLLLLARRELSIMRAAWPPLAAFALLLLLLPNIMFSVAYIPERMPVVFFLLLAASIRTDFSSRAMRIAVSAACAAFLAVRLAAVTLDWGQYREGFEAYRDVTRSIPAGALVRPMILSGSDPRDGFMPRCQMYGPMTVIDRHAAAPLFAYATQQPLRLVGRLGQARRAPFKPKMIGRDQNRVYYNYLADVVAHQRYDYLLLCGRERIKGALPDGLRLIQAEGPIALYRILPSQRLTDNQRRAPSVRS